jgi:hypothetical protein
MYPVWIAIFSSQPTWDVLLQGFSQFLGSIQAPIPQAFRQSFGMKITKLAPAFIRENFYTILGNALVPFTGGAGSSVNSPFCFNNDWGLNHPLPTSI